MAIYELKPPVVDAVQWTGKNVDEILSFGYQFYYIQTGERSWIEFRNGDRPVKMSVGDYVVYNAKANVLSVVAKAEFESQYKLRLSGYQQN